MALPVIQSKSDLPENAGRQVQVYGFYGVQDLGGHALKVKDAEGIWQRVRKIAFIELKDDCFISLENRPDVEMKVLDGRRVIATGKLVIPDDLPAQPIMARPEPVPTLVEINSIQPQPDDVGA